MRYARVPESIYRDRRISNAQLRVLVGLIGFADRDGVCNPSLRVLERELSRSRATIRHHLNGLVEIGVITRDPMPRKDGSCGANRYTIADLRGPEKDDLSRDEMPAPGAQQPSLLLPLDGGRRRPGASRANVKIAAAAHESPGLSLSTAAALAEMKEWARSSG